MGLIWRYDVTFSAEKNDRETINDFLEKFGKKWCNQLEQGDTTGYLHYQCRISLNTKKITKTLFNDICKFGLTVNMKAISPTSNGISNELFYDYCTKEHTRIEGPWTNEDKAKYIPRQYRDIESKLYPWQASIKEIIRGFDDRKINIIVDYKGNNGKSTIAHHLRLTAKGCCLPVCNDGEKIIQSACNQLMGKRIRKSVPIFIDLPRAMDKTRLYGIYTAIEQIKSGWVYDVRNVWKEWDFDSPHIFVTTNRCPDEDMLSHDRWNMWAVNSNKELVAVSFNELMSEQLGL